MTSAAVFTQAHLGHIQSKTVYKKRMSHHVPPGYTVININ